MASVKKTEQGMEFPAEAYAYVPDPEQPSTWKLRLWESPEKGVTARQVGMAIAALGPGGFRGNRVEIPREDLPKVKARVRAAWKKVHPDADPEEIPAVIRESAHDGMDTGHDGSVRLLEYATSRGATLRVDRQQAVICGVKILGTESLNGRRYEPAALASAKSLYEGKPVNVDHVDGQRRSYRDRIGRLVRVELRSDGLYGDLQVNPKHPLAEQLFWDAEHAPENVGLSHDAQGRTKSVAGRVIVESITAVRSVDLVAEPATTKSLFEGVDSSVGATLDPASSAQAAVGGQPAAEPDEDEVPPDYDVDKLPDDAFALVLPGGVKIGQRTWPLSKRWFPIHTPQAVERSLERISSNRRLSPAHLAAARARALEAARRFGMDVSRYKESIMKIEELTLEQLKEARPDLVAQIQAASEAQAELVKLKEARDKIAAELERLKTREAVAAELKEAKIAPESLPATLLESLLAAPADRRKALISDLAKLIPPHGNHAPVQSQRPGLNLPAAFEDRVRLWA